MKHIVIFASGSGTNTENIVTYFKENELINIDLIATNKATAGVLDRTKRLQIPFLIFSKSELQEGKVLDYPLVKSADLIILAGFLLKIPDDFIKAFPKKIINIHPALLPKYGGKGMYGSHVHMSVIANNEKESGITIHYVNENYDEGAIIFQKKVNLSENETPETLAKKIHRLEHTYFPKVIENLLRNERK